MRRALVLSDESARHPFRAMLPAGSLAVDEVENRRYWRFKYLSESEELRFAAMTYTAGFLATTAFFM